MAARKTIMSIQSVCLFCGSNSGVRPAYKLAAQELGEYGMVPEDLLLCIPRLLP